MQIRVEQGTVKKQKPDVTKLGFGKYFTDHMFIMNYNEQEGWHDARITPYAPIQLDPSAMVFHYGQECFEGLKAYANPDGKVRIFRPEKNAQRMQSTHERLCIPDIPEEVFVEAIRKLVEIDIDWVPKGEGTSLYIRPCTIATQPELGVKPSKEYIFFVICSPSGAYYESGINPVKIYVEDEFTRSAPGGTGYIKCGGNYGASLFGQEKAHKLGYEQVLWLDGVHRRYIEEVGSMNCFFVIDNVIYTAPTDGTVLPGIVRMSCLELLKDWGYTVKEESIAIDFLLEEARKGNLQEVFGTGTAAVVSPVGELRYKDEIVKIGDDKIGEITKRLYDTLTGVQWGTLPDDKHWMTLVK